MNSIVKIFFIILAWLLNLSTVTSQAITLTPEIPSYHEEVVLTYHADLGNAQLKDYHGDIYVHTGVIKTSNPNLKSWQNIVADWGENLEKTKMKRISKNKYELRFTIASLYGVPLDDSVAAMAFVFRNGDGSLVGKDKTGNDIYYFLQELKLKKAPNVAENTAAPHPQWSKSANIYEVNLRQYTHAGTFAAFEKHLPRLKKMGVDVLWFMPIQPIGEKKRKGPLGSYYSIKDYKGINPEFGEASDFLRLVKNAHAMDMKVVMDWVANHSAHDHAWVNSNPDFYNFDTNGNIVSPFDWTDVAELNYNNPQLRNAMIADMKYWVDEVGIDGFRCDVAGEVPVDFWEDAISQLTKDKELWMLAENADQFYLLNKAFIANYGWEFHHLMNQVAAGNEPANKIGELFSYQAHAYPKGSYNMQFITNHDENSWNGTITERLGNGHRAYAVLTWTVPGMPLIYSGQEAGLNHRLKFFEKDEINWDKVPFQSFYTKLNTLKKENQALWNGTSGGDFEWINNSNDHKVSTFIREHKDNKVLSIINLSSKPISASVQVDNHRGYYQEFFTEKRDSIGKQLNIELPAYGFKIYVFQKKLESDNRIFKSYQRLKNGLRIQTNQGELLIVLPAANAFEVMFTPDGKNNFESYAVEASQREKVYPFTYNETDDILYLRTKNKLEARIHKKPMRIEYFHRGEKLISEKQGFYDKNGIVGIDFTIDSKEILMGGGERALGMNRRGNKLKLYNKASYGYEEKADLMYYSMPVMLSSKKYAVVFDNGASGYLDFASKSDTNLSFEADGGRRSYIIMANENWYELMKTYHDVTGYQNMVPRWALGNFASRLGYHTQKEVENVVDLYHEQNIPLDAIVIDLYWFGKEIKGTLGNFDWYRDSFPEPIKMMQKFRSKGIKTILITEPFILRDTKTYQEVIDKKLVGTHADGSPYHFDFYFGNTTLLDIFDPKVKDWFWQIYKKHNETGVAGWWGDLGEPEVHPDDLHHLNGTANEVHNLYGHEWAKMIYEKYNYDFPTQRPLILMRSGFVGSQRYGILPWSGDVARTWGGLKPQVEIALQMGMQGLGYMHSDLGGFAGSEQDAELYTRWLQYGTFQPIFRTHAQEEIPAEPIFWDLKTRNIVKSFIELRYQMTPYNYTLAYENSTKGMPLMRPLFFEQDIEPLYEQTNGYMWGENIAVYPVVQKGAVKMNVYLPNSANWMNFWTGEVYAGGQSISQIIKLETIPVYIKTGSFIPMISTIQSLDQYHLADLELHYVYDISVKKSYDFMYEDDGITKNALKNRQFEFTEFRANNDGKRLKISIKSNGGIYEGKNPHRKVELIVHNIPQPKKILSNGKSVDFEYDTNIKKLNCLIPYQNKESELLLEIEN